MDGEKQFNFEDFMKINVEQALRDGQLKESQTTAEQIDKEKYENRRSDMISNQTADILRESLAKELKPKEYFRKILLWFLVIYFAIVTLLIFSIIIFLYHQVSVLIQRYLIIGLFSNVLALLVVIYRYAFSDTSKITGSIQKLLK